MSGARDIDIKLVGDDDLMKAIQNLDYNTQQSTLKRVLNDAARKTIVKALQRATPVKTGTLKRSIGIVRGKSRKKATIFVGPRWSHKGHLANIIEYNKGEPRYPGFDKKKGQQRKRPMLPDGSIKKHSGVFPIRPYMKKTMEANANAAALHMSKSIRTIIQRTWNSKIKKGLI